MDMFIVLKIGTFLHFINLYNWGGYEGNWGSLKDIKNLDFE